VTDRPDSREPDPPRPYDVSTYGERIADVYDHWPRLPANTERAVEFLAAAAGRGPILELGIGTGRLALPLAQRGFAVQGIDASPAMVAKLRAKPGGDRITIVMGNFADMAIAGRFSLIFVAFDTSVHDPVAQRVRSHHVVITAGGVKLYPVEVRYAWPSELDLMARMAGLRLRERWEGWSREAFGASSGAHVSVYERAK
jgi:SAM-dependent methyltransferase